MKLERENVTFLYFFKVRDFFLLPHCKAYPGLSSYGGCSSEVTMRPVVVRPKKQQHDTQCITLSQFILNHVTPCHFIQNSYCGHRKGG